MHDVQQARAGHAATCRLHDLNVQLPGGVYKAIARSNQGKRSIGANARQGRGGTVRARRTFPALGKGPYAVNRKNGCLGRQGVFVL